MRQREHVHGVSLMQWAVLAESEYPDLRWLHHIPNGGDRHPITAGKLKAEGVKAGVSDYHLPVARGGFIGLYIELKAPPEGKSRAGRPTKDQREWLEAMRELGHRAEVAVGWQQAMEILTDYLKRPRTRVQWQSDECA